MLCYKIYCPLIVVLSISTKFSFSQQYFNPSAIDSITQSEKKAAELKLAFKESAFTDQYDVIYMRAQWQVDPRVYYIKGNITYYIKPLFSDLQNLYFDLSDSLQFNSFIFQGITSTNFLRAGDNTVELHLPIPIPIGKIDSVTLSYEGKPTSTGFGSFTQSSHNGDSIIYTLSEPYGASDWFPCKNSLTDKMDSIDVIVRMPAKYRVGTNGSLVEDYFPDDSTRIMHWKSHYPIATYLVGIAVTNYAEFDEYAPLSSGDTVKVVEFVYKEDSAFYEANPGPIVPMIQLYSSLFGDYPFKKEKYGHAQWNWGGGEEHQTMSFVLFPNIFELIAHELGHQWFGDKITCGSWQDIWLNEGFATYLAGLTYENLAPQYWNLYLSGKLHSALTDSTGSVFCDDTTSVSRIFSTALTYSKGMYLLHMLRWKLSDPVFFSAIKDYINDPALSYGFAKTENLKQHLEDVSGENLDEFFNDWFYGKGYPSYHIKWSSNRDGTVSISVHQTQNNSAVSFFEMPLPIELKNAGRDTIIRVENNFNDQKFIAGPFSFMPDTLRFDPDLWLASTHNIVEYDSVLSNEYDSLISNPIIIFPNPASNVIQISYHHVDAMKHILLYDVSGRKLKDIDASGTGFYDPVVIDVSNLPAGFYFLELKNTPAGFYFPEIKTTSSDKIVKFIKR